METDPILIRIQAIDEATPVIIEFTDKLFKLQNMLMKFKMPELKFPEIQVPEIPEIKTPVIPTPEVPTIKPLIIPEIEIPKIPEIKIPELKAPIDFDINAGDLYKKVNVITAATKSVTLSAQQMTDVITRDFQRGLDQMNVEPIERLDQTLNEAGISSKQFANFLAKNNLEVIKGVGVYDRLSGAILTQGQAIKLATIQTRRFKFEWLSIMFAGMALDRVFGSLIRQQMTLFGVTDMMSAAWTMVLLPIFELITPFLYKLIEIFMNMPTWAQYAIGALVLIGGALGTLLTIIGQVVLAIMGFKLLGITSFAALGKAVTPFLTALLPVIAIIIGIGLVVKGVYDIVKGKFEGIGLIIMGVGAILILFIGWWALIPIAVGAAVYLIIKYWDTIKEWFSSFWNWLTSAFSGAWEKIKSGFQTLGNFFKIVWEGIKNTFKGAINGVISIMNSALSGFESMINFAIKGMNILIRQINKLPGVNIRTLSSIDLPRIPYLEEGGFIKSEGLAYLHAGERVIPKNQVNNAESSIIFSPTINLNAQVSSDYDVRKLADELNYYWARDFERMVKGRVTI